jgi:diguanylate cyclase (GGDEF)-like protein/PAS domain S-box-containing protein
MPPQPAETTSTDQPNESVAFAPGQHRTFPASTCRPPASPHLLRPAHEDTRSSHGQIANVFRSASVGLVEIDTSARFVLVNDTFCRIVGRTRQDLIGMEAALVTHPDDVSASRHVVSQLLNDGCPRIIEKRYIRPDGSPVECRVSFSLNVADDSRASDPQSVITVIEDITERKRAEARISHLATHDNLTDLPNRSLLTENLTQELQRTRSGKTACAVLALDLDRFKEVNDSFGHDTGDELLRQVAARLRNAVRLGDTVSRVGGDEFVVLQAQAVQPRAASRLAERIRRLLSQPFNVAGQMIVIECSIGIALHLLDSDTEATLLKAADLALYDAKSAGGASFRLFEPKMQTHAKGNRELEQDLRLALGTDQLKLHFQPQFSSTTGTLVGFEALLRWQHPTRGEISPMSFIPMAEATGLILPLGLWVIEKACTEAASWPKPVRVAVNLSASQFRGKKLPAQIKAILNRTGLAPERLELELTESALLKDNAVATRMFREFKAIGVQMALDDFGTGYSSLGYLRNFAFDRLKIDKSFVDVLGREVSALPLIQAIIAMSRSLAIDVIAEGVETDLQLNILREQECEDIQGYILGRPVPPGKLHQYFDPATPAPARRRTKKAIKPAL